MRGGPRVQIQVCLAARVAPEKVRKRAQSAHGNRPPAWMTSSSASVLETFGDIWASYRNNPRLKRSPELGQDLLKATQKVSGRASQNWLPIRGRTEGA